MAAVSEGARALIRRCLSVEQRLRPTAAELLADPWLAKDGTGGGGSLGANALLLAVATVEAQDAAIEHFADLAFATCKSKTKNLKAGALAVVAFVGFLCFLFLFWLCSFARST